MNYRYDTLLLFVLFFITNNALCQTIIKNPVFGNADCPQLHIDSISVANDTTILFCTYISDGYGSWANINRNAYIHDVVTDEKKQILKSIGLPLSPLKKEWGTYDPRKISVVLYFNSLSGNNDLDLIEHENNNTSFNIYNISLKNQDEGFDYESLSLLQSKLESAEFYYKCENYQTAIDKSEKLLSIVKRYYGNKSLSYLNLITRLGLCYDKIGNKKKSIEYGIKSNEICETLNDTTLTITFLESLPYDLFYSNRIIEAIQYQKKLIALRESWSKSDPKELLFSKSFLFTLLDSMGNDNEAISVGEDVISGYKSLGMESDSIYSSILNQMASLYKDHNKALGIYEELSRIEKKYGREKTVEHARTLNLLAFEYQMIGNYDKAIDINILAKSILKEISEENSYCYKYIINSLSTLYSQKDDYSKCKQMLDEELAFDKRNSGEASENYINSLSYCSNLLIGLKRYGEALDYALQEKTISERVYGKNSKQYLNALHDIQSCKGFIKSNININENIENSNTISPIIEKNGQKSNLFNVKEWTNESELCDGYINTDISNAIKHAEKALELTNGYPDAKDFRVSSLCRLSGLYSDPVVAMGYLREALNIQKDINTNSIDFLSLDANYNLYEVLTTNDFTKLNVKKQVDYWKVLKQEIIENFLFLTEQERASFWEHKKKFFLNPYALSVIADETNDSSLVEYLYDYTLFKKSLIMNTSIGIETLIKNSNNNQLLNKYLTFKKNRETLSHDEQYEQERELLKSSRALGDYNNMLNISWRDVRNSLKENEIAMEFFKQIDNEGIEQYNVLMIRKDWEHPRIAFIGYVCKIIKTRTLDAIMPAWNRLFEIGEVKKGDTIYMSLDGEINKYPIEHVLVANNEYLSDLYSFQHLTSTRELALQTHNLEIKNVTLFGGLNYDANCNDLAIANESYSNSYRTDEIAASRFGNLRSGFENLKNSFYEVVEISKLLKNSKIHYKLNTGNFGTEEAFCAPSCTSSNIIHLATHGAYIKPEESDSLADKNNYEFVANDNYSEFLGYNPNSLSRSFLVMSGGNMLPRRMDIPAGLNDEILTAKEISQMDLSKVDLVVLSACKSGLGDVYDEGILGLQYGFKKAGVKSLLISLDNIDDKATQLFMVQFYRNLLSGKSKHDSLHESQKYLRTLENGKYSDKKYWANFVLLDGLN